MPGPDPLFLLEVANAVHLRLTAQGCELETVRVGLWHAARLALAGYPDVASVLERLSDDLSERWTDLHAAYAEQTQTILQRTAAYRAIETQSVPAAKPAVVPGPALERWDLFSEDPLEGEDH